MVYLLNRSLSLLAATCLLINFANSLDPDHDRQNVDPDLNSNCLTLIEFLKDCLEKKLLVFIYII